MIETCIVETATPGIKRRPLRKVEIRPLFFDPAHDQIHGSGDAIHDAPDLLLEGGGQVRRVRGGTIEG